MKTGYGSFISALTFQFSNTLINSASTLLVDSIPIFIKALEKTVIVAMIKVKYFALKLPQP